VGPKERNLHNYTSRISGSLLKHVERYMKGERERERKREKDVSIITACHTLGVIKPQLSWLPECHFLFINELRPKEQWNISVTYALRPKKELRIFSVINALRSTKQ
jgi:hypothetical protein